jgi:putative transposase
MRSGGKVFRDMAESEDVGVRFIEPAKDAAKRKHLRLKGYNYQSDGYYFVTICTYRGKPFVSRYKEKVIRVLLSLPRRFSGLSIDWHVLMPTHVHVIFAFRGMERKLPEVVRTWKALVTRKTGIKFWQRNYYEHVIRTEAALGRIRQYIENNPEAERIRFQGFYEDGSEGRTGRMNPAPTKDKKISSELR